jgi:hypothetical protein
MLGPLGVVEQAGDREQLHAPILLIAAVSRVKVM